MKVAIAMSIYRNDNPIFLDKAINSILNQTYKNIQLFIEVDGIITDELYQRVDFYSKYHNVNVNFNFECRGLAFRLNEIIERVVKDGSFSYIARMDADDISQPDRIEKQVDFMINHQDIAVVGSDVIEIDESDCFIFYKKMDSHHDDIVKNIIIKCPINHPTAFFNISAISKIRYNGKLKNTQDYYLWIDFVYHGMRLANINEPLLKFRVDNDFYSRRGFSKAINDVKSRMYALKKLKNYSLSNIVHVFMLFFLRISPPIIKKIAYNKFR
ncbi:glycosyltransferase [Edwardsiella tarda]|uniref:glycosyltransferase n=1 Tax=Edwardsiella tarda TaxID=636 RepID=UPI003A881A4E